MEAKDFHHSSNTLRARRLGIDTYQEPVIYMRADCPICRSEGFEAQSRIQVELDGRRLIATLNVIHSEIIKHDEAGLSEAAWNILKPPPEALLKLSPSNTLESLSEVRAKIYGNRLGRDSLKAITSDIVSGLYSDVHISSFLTTCAGDRLDLEEVVELTRAMVDVGEQLEWSQFPIMDKHCVGGLPGNRTTPIVVSIVSALGLTMPKTSSRAITSPAGTADMMETLAPVDLDLQQIRRVVDREGGCIVWGGNVRLSPADDILIRIERALDLDSEGQLVASVLSKKIAAGSTHVLIDIPTGATAKVRSVEAAQKMSGLLEMVGSRLGLQVKCVVTDGEQPVGRGIGPALEARDVVAVLRGDAGFPNDLKERALFLAAQVLEHSGKFKREESFGKAKECLESGEAWRKFQSICEAQGGMREPPIAPLQYPVLSLFTGKISKIDNRQLARLAKLAGAPKAKSAGVELHAHVGEPIQKGEVLFVLHAEAPGEMAYAQEYLAKHSQIIQVEAL